MKPTDLKKVGWKHGGAMNLALRAARIAKQEGYAKREILQTLLQVNKDPGKFLEDDLYADAAASLLDERRQKEEKALRPGGSPRLNQRPVEYRVWGRSDVADEALAQIDMACRLPISVRGAQMPDGHVGYGLPIGGVLATRNAVIPYGVGVDIACRMKLSILDVPAGRLAGWREKLKRALTDQTRFGIGAAFRTGEYRQHDVMDDPAWGDLPKPLRILKDKAWSQLGTSGSGNHFVEWGEMVVDRPDAGIPLGRYLALLSHSGSRGLGANIARHYTDVAISRCPLPKQARQLAWLDLRSGPGAEYWLAMELAGRYASANHELIHLHVLRAAGLKPLLQVENHHNFAWKEVHSGEEVIVHRKGATPAASGVLGVIPGSMADPGFLVRGKGNPESLDSAAHGAGRRMSRKAAKESLTRHSLNDLLKERGVELISSGLDESPQAYKSIHDVMRQQADLVEVLAEFHPRIVLMAKGGPAED